MRVLVPLLGTVVQVAIFGAIVWAIVRAVGHRSSDEREEVDRAVSARRLFVYGLMLVTLILGAVGATMAGRMMLTADWSDDNRTEFALGLAFVLVAAPAYALLLRFARGRLREDAAERTSWSWAAYLNVALAISLIVATVTVHQFIEAAVGVDDFEWRLLAPAIVWTAVWAMHWFWLRAAHGLPGDLHLAVGSCTGLVTMMVGVGGAAYVAGDEIYASLVERLPLGHESSDLRTWLVAVVVGGAVWTLHWLREYTTAERTPLWHVYVLPIQTLGGLVMSIASIATIAYWTAVWYVGDPDTALPSEHFEHVPEAVAFAVVGNLVWQYHRAVLHHGAEIERSEPTRVYDYLMAAAGLVSAVVGATLALVALLESIADRITDVPTDVANRLVLAAILGAIGGPLWRMFWARLRAQTSTDPLAEIGSLTRRLYLIALFGVGGLTALVSTISVLFVGIDDLIDGTFGGETLHSARVGLALLLTVSGVAWYHLAVFRSDRAAIEELTPPAAPFPPPTPFAATRPVSRPAPHVVLIAPRGVPFAGALATATGAAVETWVRDDDTPMPPIDVDELIARILAEAGHDVAVVVGPDGADVIPYVS